MATTVYEVGLTLRVYPGTGTDPFHRCLVSASSPAHAITRYLAHLPESLRLVVGALWVPVVHPVGDAINLQPIQTLLKTPPSDNPRHP